MFFVLMSNKSLVLSNYYVQSSINYIINNTKNIYTASIAERLRVCRSSGVQNPGRSILILYSVRNGSSLLQDLR